MPLDLGAAALTLAISLAAVIWTGIAIHTHQSRGRRRSTTEES